MKLQITTKHIISLVVTVLFEEILRFGIEKINFQTMDKTFLITIPFSLICLLAYWIYLYLEKRFNKQDAEIKSLREKEIPELNSGLQKIIKDNDLSLREILKDHALRLGLYYQLLRINKIDKANIDNLHGNLTNEDLKLIGFDKYKVDTVEKNRGELSLSDMSDTSIKGQ